MAEYVWAWSNYYGWLFRHSEREIAGYPMVTVCTIEKYCKTVIAAFLPQSGRPSLYKQIQRQTLSWNDCSI